MSFPFRRMPMTWLPVSMAYYDWPTYYWVPTMWQGFTSETVEISCPQPPNERSLARSVQ